MAYVETSSEKRILTWDDNPHGGRSQATIVDGVVTELFIEGSNNANLLYSKEQADLEHIQLVLTQLLAELTPH
jgi:hypothetical protein